MQTAAPGHPDPARCMPPSIGTYAWLVFRRPVVTAPEGTQAAAGATPPAPLSNVWHVALRRPTQKKLGHREGYPSIKWPPKGMGAPKATALCIGAACQMIKPLSRCPAVAAVFTARLAGVLEVERLKQDAHHGFLHCGSRRVSVKALVDLEKVAEVDFAKHEASLKLGSE
jgi:hypothetical protein